jgi:hypothetical protein
MMMIKDLMRFVAVEQQQRKKKLRISKSLNSRLKPLRFPEKKPSPRHHFDCISVKSIKIAKL